MTEETYDMRELGVLLRARRGTRSLRAIAQEIGGVSASTLSRIEQGKVPDLDTFRRLCGWLGISTDRFMTGPKRGEDVRSQLGSKPSNADVVVAHLRADRTLSPETVEALVTMIRLAYEAAERGEIGRQTAG